MGVSVRSESDNNDIIDDIDDEYLNEITDEDYGFILDAEGELKSVFMAHHYDTIPEKVYAVFKLFGIDDPDEINKRISHTIH